MALHLSLSAAIRYDTTRYDAMAVCLTSNPRRSILSPLPYPSPPPSPFQAIRGAEQGLGAASVWAPWPWRVRGEPTEGGRGEEEQEEEKRQRSRRGSLAVCVFHRALASALFLVSSFLSFASSEAAESRFGSRLFAFYPNVRRIVFFHV